MKHLDKITKETLKDAVYTQHITSKQIESFSACSRGTADRIKQKIRDYFGIMKGNKITLLHYIKYQKLEHLLPQ